MSIEHIEVLYSEFPEVFEPKMLDPNWHEDLIIVPIGDAEKVSTDEASVGPPIDHVEPPEDQLLEELGPDVIQSGAPVPDLVPIIGQVLGGSHGGAPVPYKDREKMPPADCLAFYLPFHYYHPDWWGVYLLYEGVLWLAGEVIQRSGLKVTKLRAIEAARLFLYYHEAFHHKTECFATRLELTHRQPFFKRGFEQYYQNTIGTVNCIEEGLGNASSLIEIQKKLHDKIVDRALAQYVDNSPPGYDQGNVFRPDFLGVRCRFMENNQHICLPHLPNRNPEVWRSTPHLFDGISNIKSRVNYVIPRNSPLAGRLRFRPCLPPNKVIKKLRQLVGLELVREGGRHQVWRTSSGNIVEIPRHPRDLGRGLLRQILRQAGLDMGLEEFLTV